jgi:transposase
MYLSVPLAPVREIRERGYRGTDRQVLRLVRELRPRPVEEPLVRFETAAGEQMQVDSIEFRRTPGNALAAFVAVLGCMSGELRRVCDR